MKLAQTLNMEDSGGIHGRFIAIRNAKFSFHRKRILICGNQAGSLHSNYTPPNEFTYIYSWNSSMLLSIEQTERAEDVASFSASATKIDPT